MSQKVTLEQVKQLVGQLALQELLKLLAHIAERLGQALPDTADDDRERERIRHNRLQLANELLAEVEDIEDDSQGEFDAAETIRQMRDERIAQLCQKDV
jgi:DNA polymerase III gamma/tau subunit